MHNTAISPPLRAVGITAALMALAGCGASAEPATAPSPTAGTEAKGADAEEGDIRIEDAWIPEQPAPGAATAYLVVHNGAAEDDALVEAATTASDDTGLSLSSIEDSGATEMSEVDEIPVPAGGSTELMQGGFHLMLNDVVDPLAPGDHVTVTLTFSGGTEVEIETPVLERTAADEDEDDHSSHH